MLVKNATHTFMKWYKVGKEMKMKNVNIDLMENVKQLIKKFISIGISYHFIWIFIFDYENWLLLILRNNVCVFSTIITIFIF
jgi:hypothetical protein